MEKLKTKESYINILKGLYNKLTVNIKPNEEKIQMCPLRSDKWQGSPFSPLLFNVVLEVLEWLQGEANKKDTSKKEVKALVYAYWYDSIYEK